MRVLPPIKESPDYYDKIEAKIIDIFKKEIYFPLMMQMELGRKTLINSNDALLDAIRFGRIQFYRGVFSGHLNATVSKQLRALGAKWIRGAFRMPQGELPIEIVNAIHQSRAHFEHKLKLIDKRLADLVPENIADKIQISKYFDTTLWQVEKKMIGIGAPKLSDKARKKISDEWQNNMKLWIRDFTEKEILKLRRDMQETIFAGNRYESAISAIKTSYGVSERKAKFLARQETGLLMAKFKETRYTAAGITKYKWGCVAGTKNHPVRPWHRALQGKIFSWDNPPITTKPGTPVQRNNPGQDFNCRCFSIPIINSGVE